MAKNGRQGEGGGRPKIVFTEEQTNQVEKLSAVLNRSQIADYFSIGETTLISIEARQPEVREAYKRGRAVAAAAIATSLMNQAQRGNISAAIFYLKTQAGWSEKQEIQDDDAPSIAITVNALPPVKEIRITRGEN